MSEDVLELLDALEQELRRLNVWSPLPPSPEAMASSVPFCFDTMVFSQWLQWVFAPRMRALLDRGGPLPTGSDIASYAEIALPAEGLHSDDLMGIIERFDFLMK